MQETPLKITMVIFSATGNTRTIASQMAAQLRERGAAVETCDITAHTADQPPIDCSACDAVIFGFPVHSLRAPRVVRDWLRTLDGQRKKCATFFTYGGFIVHPAHQSTRTILEERGFSLVASAEFPGAHTFNLGGWRAFPQRPDQRESELAKRYVDAVYDRLSGKDNAMPGELPAGNFSEAELDQFEAFRFKVVSQLPARMGTECSLCGLCEENCPTGAMDAATGAADPAACIACLRCVADCPEHALTINDTSPSWRNKLAMSQITEEELDDQIGTLYL
ncbi:EFR1 family ferrodoxin [Pseudodesulfovibrio sp.]|uniref:EFR1 family ferrodoxin n=1 Tax=unclassified Pseudodesulfovibrio TaxID=2661612 RepID=UPI003AFFD12F